MVAEVYPLVLTKSVVALVLGWAVLLPQNASGFSTTTAFTTSPSLSPSYRHWNPCCYQQKAAVPLHASSSDEDYDDDDDDDDDDDEEEDSSSASSLEDWRKFRASLIASEQKGDDDDDDKIENNNNTNAKESLPSNNRNENEELLKRQNKALANEYKSGVWAHTIPDAEIGGLLCRLPIEIELLWGTTRASTTTSMTTGNPAEDDSAGSNNQNYWKEKLEILLTMEPMPSPSASDGISSSSGKEQAMTVLLKHKMAMADRMITRELELLTSQAMNGILNPNDVEANSRSLLLKYLRYKETWQEVCLVLSNTDALVINRPISTNINKPLAKLLLEGSDNNPSLNKKKSEEEDAEAASLVNYPFDFLDKFVQAFGRNGVVYKGGANDQTKPALLIHGIADLKGATELAPGTGIFMGGLEAAVEGVLEGKYQPLEFRFFLGRHRFTSVAGARTNDDDEITALASLVADGAYQPIACARSLALKQCLGLPKPLWHEGNRNLFLLVFFLVPLVALSLFELMIVSISFVVVVVSFVGLPWIYGLVLELCGGELKCISDIELSKRTDLQK